LQFAEIDFRMSFPDEEQKERFLQIILNTYRSNTILPSRTTPATKS
jgi:hypothetical protein